MRIYKMNEDDFNEMRNKTNYQVMILSREALPKEKIRIKTGTKKICTYRDETINGKLVPKFYVDVSFEDVFQDKEIQKYSINFQFANLEDELAYQRDR